MLLGLFKNTNWCLSDPSRSSESHFGGSDRYGDIYGESDQHSQKDEKMLTKCDQQQPKDSRLLGLIKRSNGCLSDPPKVARAFLEDQIDGYKYDNICRESEHHSQKMRK